MKKLKRLKHDLYRFWSIPLLLILSFVGCSSANSNDQSRSSSQVQSVAATPVQPPASSPIGKEPSVPAANKTDRIPPLSNYAPLTFHGYPCTVDCSGHEAGYEWAEENDITDSGDCSGDSESFIEGCQAYAEENGSDSSGDDN